MRFINKFRYEIFSQKMKKRRNESTRFRHAIYSKNREQSKANERICQRQANRLSLDRIERIKFMRRAFMKLFTTSKLDLEITFTEVDTMRTKPFSVEN